MRGCGCDDLAAGLTRITSAPLKPQQRMHLLRSFYLPRFFHAWTFGKINAGQLRRLDILIRSSIRVWLPLPHDVPLGYFHAPIKSGELGVPQLSRFIPFLRLKRFGRLSRSDVDYVKECGFTDVATRKVRWCRERLAGVVDRVKIGREALDAYWSNQLYQAYDGNVLNESSSECASTKWLKKTSRAIPSADWLHYVAIHIGAIPSRVRTSKGLRRENLNVSCRGGCRAAETPQHCIQVCHRTHGARVLRHDTIAKRIASDLMELGWKVEREVTFRTTVGVFRPDIVAVKQDTSVILDVQVVSPAPSLDDAHARKVAKYHTRADLANHIIKAAVAEGKTPPAEILFSSATISWRGVWSGQSVQSLRRHGLTSQNFARYTTMALYGSWMNWVWFSKSTASRMGGGQADASSWLHDR